MFQKGKPENRSIPRLSFSRCYYKNREDCICNLRGPIRKLPSGLETPPPYQGDALPAEPRQQLKNSTRLIYYKIHHMSTIIFQKINFLSFKSFSVYHCRHRCFYQPTVSSHNSHSCHLPLQKRGLLPYVRESLFRSVIQC